MAATTEKRHQRNSRQERDKFIGKVFQAAGLPLLRFSVRREYNPREITAQVAPLLKDKVGSSDVAQPALANTSNVVSSDSIPICPKCGIPMVLRTVMQGEHKDKQFYGCVNYPRCREVKPIPVLKAG